MKDFDSSEDVSAIIGLLVLVLVIGFLVGVGSGRQKQYKDDQKEAISRGFGQYNATNGVFEWKK